MNFKKCKRRFDVTVKIHRYQEYSSHASRAPGYYPFFESTVCVWANGPSLHALAGPIYAETNTSKDNARLSILYVREHEFTEYSPAQLGKMMAHEGCSFSENPFVDDAEQAKVWDTAFDKELEFIKKRK